MIKMGIMFVLGFLLSTVIHAMGTRVDGMFRFDTEAEEPIVLTLTSDINDILRRKFIILGVETNIKLKGKTKEE